MRQAGSHAYRASHYALFRMRCGECAGPPVLRGMRRASGRNLPRVPLREPAVRQVLRRLRRATWCGSRSACCPGVAGGYTPKPLAERILRSRGALEGERKQVTVLFSDIKGSMELIQGSDPEEARRAFSIRRLPR